MLIGVDMDDVLANMHENIISFYNREYNGNVKKNDITDYRLKEILDITEEREREVIDNFYESRLFREQEPVSGSVSGIEELSRDHELSVITARESKIRKRSLDWLDEYFPNKFSNICFSNDGRFSGSKGDACLIMGVDVMIEDHIDYARDCGSICEVLLLDYPWNRNEELPNKVKRVHSWEEIVEEIYSLDY